MDRHFDVPADIAYMPDSVRIRSVALELYPGGRRLKCALESSNFNTFSEAVIVNEDHEGQVIASSNIFGLQKITSMFSFHMLEPTVARCYTAKVVLTFPRQELVDGKVIGLSIPHLLTYPKE